MTRSCPTRRASDLPITIDDHQNSPWIVRPLHLLDCCLISDGAVCVIITSTERARDLRKPPVLIAGFGRSEEHTSEPQSLMRISYAVFCLNKKICITYNKHKQHLKRIHTTSQ